MFTAKDLRKLILPLIVEQFLAVTIGMADTIMVASTGEAAMSSVSLVDAINILLINIFSALATGGAIVASQYLGREDNKRANVAAKQLLLVTTAMSVFIMAVCLIGRNPILDLIFGKIEPEVMDNCRVYFFWSALSYPFLAVYNAGAALYRSMGNSKVSMLTSTLMNAINIAGNGGLSFPVGLGADTGLPVGVQIIAPPFKDKNMFRAAAALEQHYGPAPVAPDFADGKVGA